MSALRPCIELQISLSPHDATGYVVELRADDPTSRVLRIPERAVVRFDQVALLNAALDPQTYGRQLFSDLFAAPNVLRLYDEARAVAQYQQRPLRIRFLIQAPELYELRWETLHDSRAGGGWLPAVEQLRFSRFLSGKSWEAPEVSRAEDQLRALIVIANPRNLAGRSAVPLPNTWPLEPVDVEQERRRARQGLGELYQEAHVLASDPLHPGLVSLGRFLARLREGFDIVYLVCHGVLNTSGEQPDPHLLLEKPPGTNDPGAADRVSGTALVDLVMRLTPSLRPRLVVLASCQSGGSGEITADALGALAAIGPQLVMAGVPAVLAMQGSISMITVAAFLPTFFGELRKDWQLDRAVAVARSAVAQRHDRWMPVLYMCVRDGLLWPTPSSDDPIAVALRRLESIPLDTIPDPASLPEGSRMPFSANRLFVGREGDLMKLAQALKGGATAAIGQIAAATGLGGIGKTSLATEFAHRYGQYFAGGVFWLSFAEPANIPTEIAACGGPGAMNLPGLDGRALDEQVALVRREWHDPIPRLLIFDNCEDEGLLAWWRPASGGCHILVTSRRAEWDLALGVTALPLDVLPRAESIALLRKFRPDLPPDDADLNEIADELGDLPLALHLAGSFLKQFRAEVAPADYLVELRDEAVLGHESLQGVDLTVSPTNHDLHVGRTFALSYERLRPDDPVDLLALALLARAAYFAPGEPTPRDLLIKTVELSDKAARRRASKALKRLADLGLLEAEEDGALTLHRLLARFMESVVADDEAQGAVEQALGTTAAELNRKGYPLESAPIHAHLRQVTTTAMLREETGVAWLCNEMGYLLRKQGEYAAARPYYERALAIREQMLGPEHPDTARSLNNLGALLQEQGEYTAARPYYERALAIFKQVLGPEHPDTATSLNDLGLLLQEQGEYAAARPYYEHALAIYKQVLGPEHPYIATNLNNLGYLLKAQGEYAAARPYYERALAIREQVLGPEHPDTAQSLNSLGALLDSQGEYAAARPYYERALAIREQV